MPKEYPGFIIDRSKRSAQSKHSDDYVVCTDTEVGFVAKVYRLAQSQIEAHNERVAAMPPDEAATRFCAAKVGNRSIVILEVVHLLHPPMVLKSKMQSLLKKAMKAYLYGEERAVAADGSSLDRQIAMIESMRDMHIAQRSHLEELESSTVVNTKIAILNEAIASLKLLNTILSANGKAH